MSNFAKSKHKPGINPIIQENWGKKKQNTQYLEAGGLYKYKPSVATHEKSILGIIFPGIFTSRDNKDEKYDFAEQCSTKDKLPLLVIIILIVFTISTITMAYVMFNLGQKIHSMEPMQLEKTEKTYTESDLPILSHVKSDLRRSGSSESELVYPVIINIPKRILNNSEKEQCSGHIYNTKFAYLSDEEKTVLVKQNINVHVNLVHPNIKKCIKNSENDITWSQMRNRKLKCCCMLKYGGLENLNCQNLKPTEDNLFKAFQLENIKEFEQALLEYNTHVTCQILQTEWSPQRNAHIKKSPYYLQIETYLIYPFMYMNSSELKHNLFSLEECILVVN